MNEEHLQENNEILENTEEEEQTGEMLILWPGSQIIQLNHREQIKEYLTNQGFYSEILEEATPEMANALIQQYITEEYYKTRKNLDCPVLGMIVRLEIKYTVDGRVYGGIKIAGNNIADAVEHYFFIHNFALYFDDDGDFIARENFLQEYGYRVFFREILSFEDFLNLKEYASRRMPLTDFINKFKEKTLPLGRYLGE